MFCGIELAERIERAEAELIARWSEAARARLGEAGGFVVPIAGGVACFAEEGSPLNKVAGLGFGGVPGEDELGEVERRFAAVSSPVQIELAHLADPAVGETLTGRGYRLVGFENVLGRPLDDALEKVAPAGVEVRPSGDADFDRWLDTVLDAFAHPDAQGIASHEEFPREVVARAMRDLTASAGVRRYLALHEGHVAGGASLHMAGGVAQFTGAATLPTFRRRGVQTALLSTRLAAAAAEGCDIAVITTQPASRSQQNAQGRGFSLLYTRAVLVKPSPRAGR